MNHKKNILCHLSVKYMMPLDDKSGSVLATL